MTHPNDPTPDRAPQPDDAHSDANAETVPDESASDLRRTAHEPPKSARTAPAPVPERLGKYRVLGEVGRGGMGSVYAAVRTDDAFKQRVAIKIMRLGLDTEDMLTRFELERQVLGAINHPNIARVYDAGVTPDGRPYFVMELVEGKPIDRYCDENMLSLQARLKLFAKVCAAVHVAHQNLVVHRDIKPANILVNADGEPKLLDFGIAKLLNPELAAIDPMTRADQRLLTYEYASPEQVTGDPITTASDVYALGVLLYELLAGHRPYEITKRVYEEAVRIICSTEPQRPSTAVSRAITTRGVGNATETITAEEIARRREMQLARLKRRLSGDLDNIVLKAMRKTPNRRYASAEELASDIDRHLTGQTVTARPPTWDYRAGKFIRRHKVAVAAAAVIALTVLTATAATTWQWREARAQQTLAETRYQQLRELTRVFDRIEADTATLEGATAARRVITDALVRTLESIAPLAASDPQLSLDLAAGYRRAASLAGGEGGDLAAAAAAITAADAAIGRVDPEIPGHDAESARIDLEASRIAERAGDPAEAASRALRAAETAEAAAVSAASPKAGSLAVETLEQLATSRLRTGDIEPAAQSAKRAMDAAQRTLEAAPDDPTARVAVAQAHEIVGRTAAAARDHARAIDAFSRGIAQRESLTTAPETGAENLRRLMTLHTRRGREHLNLGDLDAAEADFNQLRSLAEKRVQSDPFSGRAFEDLVRVDESVGDLWYTARDASRALAAYKRFAAGAREAVDRDPLNRQRQRMLALALKKVADAHRSLGNAPEAIAEYRRSLAQYLPLLEADPQSIPYRFDELWISYFLGRLLEDDSDADAARRAFDRGLAAGDMLLSRPDPEPRWSVITAECARGAARQHLARSEGPRAVELLERAQTLRTSNTWNTLQDEARAFRLVADADAERDRLQRLIDVVNELDAQESKAPDEAITARENARQRLAELN